ncbi:hypothetical protein B0T25DRAFT_104611 [Lasiosphaeria hispida]|uniref:Zn(2)-C6 fungal-type domain-containing protein n=1 Tax=Lasiosphaeria hispida TaxID=260671 RepID=A0AAJ0HR03_9PEZI|nr:hypothetical protein B0T25DRAFT_104611 [Lasiosphaeria hispida]
MTLTFSHLSADSFESHLKAGRKRPRVREAVSCWQCRTRKIKCNRELPCQQCQSRGIPSECTYTAPKDHQPAPTRTRAPRKRSVPDAVDVQASDSTSVAGHLQTPPDSSPEPASTAGKRGSITSRGNNAFQGSAFKTRMIGLSHWMAPCSEMVAIKALLDRSVEFRASRQALAELKALLRARNALPPPNPALAHISDADKLRLLIPDRHACEKWVAKYCKTYNRVYSILDPAAVAGDLDALYSGSLSNPVHIAKLLLAAAIAMQDTETERLYGRRLARYVEDCIHSSSRFQKPCIGVVQVLLLLIIVKVISASDTDKMYELLALQGLTSQIVSSMGLHRDPALFAEVTPYNAEMRKRLWACFVRLSLYYCIRSGTQLNIRLDESDCPPPTIIDLHALEPSTANTAFRSESETHTELDMAFGIVAARLARIIAPVHQSLYSPNPPDLGELQRELQASFSTLLAELPPALRQGAKTSDPIEELQQYLLSVSMHSFMSIIALHYTLGTGADHSQRNQLAELWDYASSVLHQFQTLCQNTEELLNITFHLLWADAGRAAITACWVIGRLRQLDDNRIMSFHPQHTIFVYHQLLTKSLSCLSQTWQSRYHLGPVAAKVSVIIGMTVGLVEYLYSEQYSSGNAQQAVMDQGVTTAERLIADMRLGLHQRQSSVPTHTDMATQSSSLPFPALTLDTSTLPPWHAEGPGMPNPSAPSSSDSATFLGHDFLSFGCYPGDMTLSSLLPNFRFPVEDRLMLQDPTLTSYGDASMESLWG